MMDSNVPSYKRIRPELRETLDAMPPVVYTVEGIAEQRAGCEYLASHPEMLPTDAEVRVYDRYVAIPGNSRLRLRIYVPCSNRDMLPGVLWLHGGGMAIGIPEADEGQNLRFAKEVSCVVVAPDYRLAPEHPHPVPADDSYGALVWFYEHAEELGVDKKRLAVAGMSGGGGLALSVALRSRDAGGPPIAFLSLNAPMVSTNTDTPSMRQDYDPRTLTRQGVIDLWGHYIGHITEERTPYMEPILGNFSGLPPTYVSVGEVDPFRDAAIALATKLMAGGVSTEFHIYSGCYHVFDAIAPSAGISRYAVGEVARALRDGLYCSEQVKRSNFDMEEGNIDVK